MKVTIKSTIHVHGPFINVWSNQFSPMGITISMPSSEVSQFRSISIVEGENSAFNITFYSDVVVDDLIQTLNKYQEERRKLLTEHNNKLSIKDTESTQGTK